MLLREAKKEGRLSIFSVANGQLRGHLIKAMREKFGIEVEISVGRAADLTPRLANERKAGIYNIDVYMGGAPDSFINKRAGFLESFEDYLILPEVRDEKAWWEGRIPWHDRDKQILSHMANSNPHLTINTAMAKKEEINSYLDLLKPRWKGKVILNDPTTPGIGQFWFTVTGYFMPGGMDFLRELVRVNPPMVTRDQRLQVEWLAQGKYHLAIAAQASTRYQFIELGAPLLGFDTAELKVITPSSGNVSLLKNAPHPNAAKVFINWLLSREGQTIYSEAMGHQSARKDGPTGHLGSEVRKEGEEYFSVINEEFIKVRDEYAKYAQEIFGPLLK